MSKSKIHERLENLYKTEVLSVNLSAKIREEHIKIWKKLINATEKSVSSSEKVQLMLKSSEWCVARVSEIEAAEDNHNKLINKEINDICGITEEEESVSKNLITDPTIYLQNSDNFTTPERKWDIHFNHFTRPMLHINEAEKIIKRAYQCNYFSSFRNATIGVVMLYHALKIEDVASLRWSDINLNESTLTFKRFEDTTITTHYITNRVKEALRQLWSTTVKASERGAENDDWVFKTVSNRGRQMHCTTIYNVIDKMGQDAGYNHHVYAQYFRHAMGIWLKSTNVTDQQFEDFFGKEELQLEFNYKEFAPKEIIPPVVCRGMLAGLKDSDEFEGLIED